MSAPDLKEGDVPVYVLETTPSEWLYPYTFEGMVAPALLATHDSKILKTHQGRPLVIR